jgi:hypothetical protein
MRPGIGTGPGCWERSWGAEGSNGVLEVFGFLVDGLRGLLGSLGRLRFLDPWLWKAWDICEIKKDVC